MVKNQVSAIINVLFSMASVFVAIFIWMKASPDYLVCQRPETKILISRESSGVYSLQQWSG
jgi:hypothetical protein